MSLERLELDDPRWLAFVRSRPEAGPFHHPAWASLLAQCYGFRGFALLDGEAGLPVLDVGRGRLVSLPFTDACAPLGDFRAAVPRLEVRAALPGLPASVRGVVHRLALSDDLDAVRRGFRSQMRRNVARAEREGVVVRAAETRADLLDVFYGLHLRTRHRQGVPVQPRRFFRLLWEDLHEHGLGTTLIALAGTTPVAAAVFLHWNGTTVYKFGASDPAYWSLRPNNLLFWEAIRAACARGDRSFDFGRTELENAGLREFKSGWGAVEEPLVYTNAGGEGRVARALAPAIRRAPLWLCRALGETAYRYAA
jgi:CelD/BcsL family acetyltransferase involved in cellulose biosynthesis